jgi:hypothetical protein
MGSLLLAFGASPSAAQPIGDPPFRVGDGLRLSTANGRVVCRAFLQQVDRSGLRVTDTSLSSNHIAWVDLQGLWIERREFVSPPPSPFGWIALTVLAVGTTASVRLVDRTEGFAPLMLPGLLLMVMGTSYGIWFFGDELWPKTATEQWRWHPVPLQPNPVTVPRTEEEIERFCP